MKQKKEIQEDRKKNGCAVCGKAPKVCKCSADQIAAQQTKTEVTTSEQDVVKEVVVGGVTLKFYQFANTDVANSGLLSTLKDIDTLTYPQIEAIATSANPDGIGDKTREEMVELAKSLVQLKWYEVMKGEIPMKVKANHSKRVAKKGSKGNGKAPSGERKPRELTVFRVGAKGDTDKLKGQEKQVFDCLKKMGGGTKREVAAKLGKAFVTKQDPEHVIGWIMWNLQARKGMLVKA